MDSMVCPPEPKLIPYSSFTNTLYHISEGKFSKIYRTVYGSTKVAIKSYLDPNTDPKIEGKIHARASHVNIIKLIGYIDEPLKPGLVLELCIGGNLNQYLRYNDLSHTIAQRESIAENIIRGILYLHEICRIIHRDIKPANIVLDNTGGKLTAKITDFGISNQLEPGKDSCTAKPGGTPFFVAPEIITTQNNQLVVATCASDIFSFGHIIHLLVQNRQTTPIIGVVKKLEVLQFIKDGKVKDMPLCTEHCALTTYTLIRSCHETEPTKRCTAKDILEGFESGRKLFNYPEG